MKNLFIAVVLAALAVGGYMYLTQQTGTGTTLPAAASHRDASYKIAGAQVTLVNGVSEVEAAPGSASKIVTKYFGNEVTGDISGDGIPDTAFILTQNTGGSGTFYYVVAAVKTADGYNGSEAVLLGDRIAPQTTEIKNGNVVVNYADRKPGEDFTVQPSMGKSIFLKLDPASMQFGEVVQNFEGEANPSSMKLDMQTWKWIQTAYAEATVVPKNPKFTLTFKSDSTFSATTDCNGVGGEYTVKGDKIVFSKMMSTLMFCEGSQEADFTKMLTEAQSYRFTTKGELVLTLKGGGTMTLK